MFFRVSLGQSECMSMSAFLRKRCTAALKNIEHLTREAFDKNIWKMRVFEIWRICQQRRALVRTIS